MQKVMNKAGKGRAGWRILSLMLSFVMVFSMVIGYLPPIEVQAAGEYGVGTTVHVTKGDELKQYLSSLQSYTIILDKDINYSESGDYSHWCTVAGTKVLNMNGHSIKVSNDNNIVTSTLFNVSTGAFMVVDASAKAKLDDVSITYDGYINENGDFRVRNIFEVNGKLVTNGVQLVAGRSKKEWIGSEAQNCYKEIEGKAVILNNGGIYVMNGGKAYGRGLAKGVISNTQYSPKSEVYINEGIIDGRGYADCLRCDYGGVLRIASGHFEVHGLDCPVYRGGEVYYANKSESLTYVGTKVESTNLAPYSVCSGGSISVTSKNTTISIGGNGKSRINIPAGTVSTSGESQEKYYLVEYDKVQLNATWDGGAYFMGMDDAILSRYHAYRYVWQVWEGGSLIGEVVKESDSNLDLTKDISGFKPKTGSLYTVQCTVVEELRDLDGVVVQTYTRAAEPVQVGIRLPEGSVEVNQENFKDPYFMLYVELYCDSDHDYLLTQEELEAVKELNVGAGTNYEFTSLQGVQNFPYLQAIHAKNNPNLRSVDCSGLTFLMELDLEGCSIDELNVSGCSNLRELNLARINDYVDTDGALSSIDITDCALLERLSIYKSKLQNVDISKNPRLVEAALHGTEEEKAADGYIEKKYAQTEAYVRTTNNVQQLFIVAHFDEDFTNDGVRKEVKRSPGINDDNILTDYEAVCVTGLEIEALELTSADFLKYFPELSFLQAYGNNLTSIDFQWNPKLETVYIDNNDFQSLDVTMLPELEWLTACRNRSALGNLDFTGNSKLTNLDLSNSGVRTINVEGLESLSTLQVSGNLLEGLDTRTNTSLRVLNVSDNGLFDLDISQNQKLESLSAAWNPICDIDLDGCPLLHDLYLYDTFVEYVDFSGVENLRSIYNTGTRTEKTSDYTDKNYVQYTSASNTNYKIALNPATKVYTGQLMILTQPKNYYGFEGDTAVFQVDARGEGVTYRWQYFMDGIWYDSEVSDYYSPEYHLELTQENMQYPIRCHLKDANGADLYTDTVWMVNYSKGEVFVNVVAPVVGQAPSSEVIEHSGNITVENVTWQTTDTKFVAGQEYTVTITIKATSGYQFQSDFENCVGINGQLADVESVSYEKGGRAVISGTFDTEEPKFTQNPETVYLAEGEKTATLHWKTNFKPVKLAWIYMNWTDGCYESDYFDDPTITSAEMSSAGSIIIYAWYGDGSDEYIESESGAIWDPNFTVTVPESLTFNSDTMPQRLAIGFTGDAEELERIEIDAHCVEFVNVKDDTDRIAATFYDKENLEIVDHISVAGKQYSYVETSYGNKEMNTIAGTYKYVYVDGDGTEEQFAALKNILPGKIAICNRGGLSFSVKANNAVKYGAAGVIIADNQAGIVNMNLSDYSYDKPVVSISRAAGVAIKSAATYVNGTQPYYTGTISIDDADSLNATVADWTAGSGNIGFHIGVDKDSLTPGATYKGTVTYSAHMNNGYRYDDREIPISGSTEVTLYATVKEVTNASAKLSGLEYPTPGLKAGDSISGMTISADSDYKLDLSETKWYHADTKQEMAADERFEFEKAYYLKVRLNQKDPTHVRIPNASSAAQMEAKGGTCAQYLTSDVICKGQFTVLNEDGSVDLYMGLNSANSRECDTKNTATVTLAGGTVTTYPNRELRLDAGYYHQAVGTEDITVEIPTQIQFFKLSNLFMNTYEASIDGGKNWKKLVALNGIGFVGLYPNTEYTLQLRVAGEEEAFIERQVETADVPAAQLVDGGCVLPDENTMNDPYQKRLSNVTIAADVEYGINDALVFNVSGAGLQNASGNDLQNVTMFVILQKENMDGTSVIYPGVTVEGTFAGKEGTFRCELPANQEWNRAYAFLMARDVNGVKYSDVSYVSTIKEVEAVAPSGFDLTGANMNLGNALAMNFYVKKSNLDPNKEYYAEIKKAYVGGNVAVRQIPMSKWSSYNDELYKIVFNGIAAKEMNDRITVQILEKDGTAVSKLWKDSIVDYVKRALEKQKPYVQTAMVDMLNYGAAAQKALDYDTGNLANSWLSATQKAYASEAVSGTNAQKKIKNYQGCNLNLGSNLCMNMYFTTLDPTKYSTMYAVLTYKNHNDKECSVRVDGSKFMKYGDTLTNVRVEVLAVAEVNNPVECKVYSKDGNALLGHGIDSIGGYIARQTTTNELFDAIMKFSSSAYKCFHPDED